MQSAFGMLRRDVSEKDLRQRLAHTPINAAHNRTIAIRAAVHRRRRKAVKAFNAVIIRKVTARWLLKSELRCGQSQ